VVGDTNLPRIVVGRPLDYLFANDNQIKHNKLERSSPVFSQAARKKIVKFKRQAFVFDLSILSRNSVIESIATAFLCSCWVMLLC
jgi:hypothetical protein